MSDAGFSAADGQAAAPDPTAQPSAGTLLRLAREAQGLHIAALAVALKVPVKKLEALEADRFDLLPDTVFVRALAASVSRTLKIDPAPILDRLPVTTTPHLKTDAAGINTPFRVSGQGSGLAFWDQLSKPVVLAVLVLLVGVVVLVFFPFNQLAEISSAAKSGVAALTSPPPTLTSAPMATENPVATGGVASTPNPSASMALSGSEASLPMYPAVVAPAASVPAPAASAMAVVVPGSGATTGVLIIKASGSSWVEVVDASGVVQVRKILTNGEVVGASGAAPLSVVVGRADAVEVEVRGKPFDLTRLAKDNVARFEVK